MILRRMTYGMLIITLLCLASCGPTGPKSHKVTVATAANMQFAMRELIQVFTDSTGIPCDMSVGSSGKLTAQIKAGAPFDIFVSADTLYANEIYASKRAEGPPRIYAYGQLVLWQMADSPVPALGRLSLEGTRHIAMANPNIAPYGKAAKEVMQHLGIYDQVESKLVFGESIAQTNQFILSQAADMGFTARAVVLSPTMQGKGKWEAVEPGLYEPIAQAAVLLKNQTEQKLEASAFYDFLFTPSAQKILDRYGYALP